MTSTKLTPTTVVALLALVLALTGTGLAGYAAGKGDGDSLIKKKSLSGNRLRPETVTGRQVKESSLGKVPAATAADRATTATHASAADTTPAGVLNAPSYTSGWGDNTGFAARTAGFRKDASGYVHLEGAVSRSTGAETVIATLPVGFRPSDYVNFPVTSQGPTLGFVSVEPDGDIHFDSGNPGFVSLEGITFHADQ